MSLAYLGSGDCRILMSTSLVYRDCRPVIPKVILNGICSIQAIPSSQASVDGGLHFMAAGQRDGVRPFQSDSLGKVKGVLLALRFLLSECLHA